MYEEDSSGTEDGEAAGGHVSEQLNRGEVCGWGERWIQTQTHTHTL